MAFHKPTKTKKQKKEEAEEARKAGSVSILSLFRCPRLSPHQDKRRNIIREAARETEEAFLGYCMVPFGTWKGIFTMGTLNPRRPDPAQAKNLHERIQLQGLQNDVPEHALKAFVTKGHIKESALSQAKEGPYHTIEAGGHIHESTLFIKIIAGQHRLIVLHELIFIDALKTRNAILMKLKEDVSSARKLRLKADLAEAQEALSGCCWLVAFYDQGACLGRK